MRFAALLLALAACTQAPVGGSPSDPPAVTASDDDLAAAWSRWRAADVSGYTMTITRSCFCPPEWRGPYAVAVADGEIASVRYDADAAVSGPVTQGAPPTVEALFGMLEDAYASGAARVDVTYHETLGYPVQLYIDQDERMADEEIGYAISELTRG